MSRLPGNATALYREYGRQRAGYERLLAASRQYGCRAIGSTRPEFCRRLRYQLDRAGRALHQIERQRARQVAYSDQRRAVLLKSLKHNRCRRAASSQGGASAPHLLRRSAVAPSARHEKRPSTRREAYRTLCVRTCDGYYWPISFGVPSNLFTRDAELCKASCPNQQVELYVHRTVGEWSDKAVSLDGKPYTSQPWAFEYRSSYRPECTCAPLTPMTVEADGKTPPDPESSPPASAAATTVAEPAAEAPPVAAIETDPESSPSAPDPSIPVAAPAVPDAEAPPVAAVEIETPPAASAESDASPAADPEPSPADIAAEFSLEDLPSLGPAPSASFRRGGP